VQAETKTRRPLVIDMPGRSQIADLGSPISDLCSSIALCSWLVGEPQKAVLSVLSGPLFHIGLQRASPGSVKTFLTCWAWQLDA